MSFKSSALLGLLCVSCIEYDTIKIQPSEDLYASIQVEPEFIDFGAVEMGETKSEVLQVSNIGNDVLNIDNVFLSDGAFSFQLPEGELNIEPGASVDVLVSYNPINVADSRKLHIESNAIHHPELDVPLLGQAAYPALRITPNPYSFDWVEVGSVGQGSLVFESIGPVPVVVENALILESTFDVGEITFPFTIPSGESITFPVTFAPEMEKDYVGDLWVQSNSPGPDIKVELHGLAGSGSISGRICDPSGDGWIVGGLVSVSIDYNNDGIEDLLIQDHTDSEGRYTLEGVTVGVHTITVQKGSYSTEFVVDFRGGNFELETETCLDPTSVNVAVVLGDFDNIGALLSDLEIPFDSYNQQTYMELLTDPNKLAEYDIVFFNCGMPMDWVSSRGTVSANLKNYVAEGGSIYASDWAHGIVEATFPYAIDFHGDDDVISPDGVGFDVHEHPYVGTEGNVLAEVLDPVMASAIGHTQASLYYDLDSWVLPEAVGPGSSAMLTGDTYYYTPTGAIQLESKAPLAIQFAAGGRVIYTSFHNEHQMTQDMEKALKEIILSL